jgi:hypothetical protein
METVVGLFPVMMRKCIQEGWKGGLGEPFLSFLFRKYYLKEN